MIELNLDFALFVRVFVNLIFIGMSIPLRKVKRNSFLGIRLKRALENEVIWKKTNRFTANAIVFCSISSILIAPFIKPDEGVLYVVWNLLLVLPIILGVIYCYICDDKQ